MLDVRTAHTADLAGATLAEARRLLVEVFAGDFDSHDWEHALGGIHALAWERGRLVGHASVVQRRLLHRGRALRTGYVEGVGVLEERRRRGYGAALMQAVERVILGAYELGALGSTDEAASFYARRGWRRWEGPTWALTPAGLVRTRDADAAIHVLPAAAEVAPTEDLTCDWRDGDVW